MNAKAIAPLQDVDPAITLIYQGPLEFTPWKSFLEHLRKRMDCDFTAISVRPGRVGAMPLVVLDSREPVNEQGAKSAAAQHARLAHLDPLGNALSRPGDIFTLDEVIPHEKYVQTEFYDKVIRPYGIEFQLGMYFSEPSGWKCNIGLMNGPAGGNFGDEEKQFFLAFRPHLERALELYAKIKRGESERRIFEETLDRLTIGTFILDGGGRIIDSNTVGKEIARQNDRISVVGNKLVLARTEDNGRLQKMIREAVEWRESRRPDTFVDALRVESRSGATLGILVRAASTLDPYRSEASPSVIVYVSDSAQQHLAPERFVARLFGLTPSEALLATLLANGYTLSEAAVKLDVTENTVRSYAKKMFGKTGVSRQADLVRLILTSVALLA